MNLLRRLLRVFTSGGSTEAPRPAVSVRPGEAWMTAPPQVRMARARLLYAAQTSASAERLAHRGWDWDITQLGPRFHGQAIEAGLGDAKVVVDNALGGLQRAADMFASAASAWKPGIV